MFKNSSFKKKLFNLTPANWENHALALFKFQATHNKVYQQYLKYLGVKIDQVKNLDQIPFLPIEFFKSHRVTTGNFRADVVFQSSGTTQQARSKHYLPSDTFYKQNARNIFEFFYGPLQNYIFMALLPSYLEQGQSSLVAMMDHFIQKSGQEFPGFYLHDLPSLQQNIHLARRTGKKIILVGVTYALLDLADFLPPNSLFDIIIMETGGMKGRRKEMIREELHNHLQNAFGVASIHSEYGMTELLSQAYSTGKGIFMPAPTIKVFLRDLNDPLSVSRDKKTGGLNIIDLANVDSCAFLETKDVGKKNTDGSFEVLGRFDNSDIRGCNLLVS